MDTTVIRRRKLVLYCLRRRDLVLSCSQEKETGALEFSRRRKLALYCSCFQEKGTGVLLFSGEGQWGCTYRIYLDKT